MSNYTPVASWSTKDALASSNPLKTVSATELGTEFTAISNMSATKEDTANKGIAGGYAGLDGNSIITAGGINVNGATLPANGIYLSAANTLTFASNSVLRGTVGSTGSWVISAPTSGLALQVNAVSGAGALQVVGSGAAAALAVSGGNGNTITTGTGVALTVTGVSGTHSTKITDSATNSFNAGYLEIPQNSQTVGYTAVLSDNGKHIFMNGASLTFTIPANATVAFPVGTVLTIINGNASALSIAITTDTMTLVNSTTTGTRTLAQNGMATAIKTGTTSWLISGSGLT